MLSFALQLTILLHLFFVSCTCSIHLSINDKRNNVQHAPLRRSLLPKKSYHFITNITLEINEISTSDPYPSIIETIYKQLNTYYNATYNSSLTYNLSILTYTTSNTTNSIELILMLSTKNAISRHDIQQLQQHIDDNISSDLYTVTITHFTESPNSGNTNELSIEILIIVFALLFVVIFIIIWVWRWRRRVHDGKAEVYFMHDYDVKDAKPTINENEFPAIKQKESHDKEKKTEIEMVDNNNNKQVDDDDAVAGNEVYDEEAHDDDPEIENEIDSNIEDERDEEDEKAEELQLPETVNVGENIVIEDDD